MTARLTAWIVDGLDGLEPLAHRVASLLWDRSVSASVAVLIVTAIWAILRHRLSSSASALLFLGALSPLLFPVEALVPNQLASVTPQAQVRTLFDSVARDPFLVESPTEPIDATRASAVGVAMPATSTEAGEPAGGGICLVAVAFVVWMLVVSAWLFRFVRSQWRTARAVRLGTDLSDHPAGALLERLARRAGVRRPVRLVRSTSVASPATWGVFRPVILMPSPLLAGLSNKQLAWIMQHELSHVRRGDVAVSAVQRLVQIVYCFHPVVWIVGPLVDQLREYACDDLAIASAKRSRQHCAEGFLRVVEHASSGRAAAAPGAALFKDATFLRRRLERMIDERRDIRIGVSRAALVCVAAVLCVALPAVSETPAHAASSTAGPSTSHAIAAGLDWLVDTQSEGGRWSAGIYADREPDPERNLLNDAGVTGLAVLALLGDTRGDARCRDAAMLGVDWLLGVQDASSGQIHPLPSVTQIYNHGYATLALARAARGSNDEELRDGLSAAVAYILGAQSRTGGWTYQAAGPSNSSITGLMLLSLCAARVSGADVPDEALARGVAFLASVTDDSGRTGYLRTRTRTGQAPAGWVPTEALTALSVIVRVHLGEASTPESVLRGAVRVTEQPPRWQERAIDFYYWFCGTTALAMAGGDAFESWRTSLVDAIVPRQRTAGSWPAVDSWSHLGGDVYATAMCVLSLQECSSNR